MSEDKIIVKFIPEGDKALVAAINNLDISIRQLLLTSAKSIRTSSKQILNNNKLSEQIVKLKLDNEKLRINIAHVNKNMAEYNKNTIIGTRNTRILGGSIAVLRSKLLVASFAFAMLSKTIGSFAKESGRAMDIFNKFNVVFGEGADKAREWAQSFSNSVGYAQHTIEEYMSTFQDVFVPIGFARDKATILSKALTQLALDVSSFNDKVDPDVISSFKSAITGISRAVLDYGIIIRAAELEEKAYNFGITETVRELTEEEKVLTRVTIMVKSSKDAIGDKKKTLHDYNNALKTLGENWKTTSKAIGDGVKPLAAIVVDLASHFIRTDVLKGYAIAITGIVTALVLYKRAAIMAAIATTSFKYALIKTGIGVFVVALGEMTASLLRYKNAAALVPSVNDDIEASLKRLTEELKNSKTGVTDLTNTWEIYGDQYTTVYDQIIIAKMKLNGATEKAIKISENEIWYINEIIKLKKDYWDKTIEERRAIDHLIITYDTLRKLNIQLIDQKYKHITVEELLDPIFMRTNTAITQNIEFLKSLVEQYKGTEYSAVALAEMIAILNSALANVGQSVYPKKTSFNEMVTGINQVTQATIDLSAASAETTLQQLELAKAATIANSIAGAAMAFKDGGIPGALAGIAMMISMMANLAQIDNQIAEVKKTRRYAYGGLIRGKSHSSGGEIIEAEGGEYVFKRDTVKSIGIETLNKVNETGKLGNNINVYITAPLIDETVRDSIIPAIVRAQKMGLA